jgi:hypothetical protein
MTAGRIRVGGDVEAPASGRETEGREVIGRQGRDHRHAGHDRDKRQHGFEALARRQDRHRRSLDRKAEADGIAEQTAERATRIV